MVVLARMNASVVKTFLYIKMALRLYLCLLIVEQVPFLLMVLGQSAVLPALLIKMGQHVGIYVQALSPVYAHTHVCVRMCM